MNQDKNRTTPINDAASIKARNTIKSMLGNIFMAWAPPELLDELVQLYLSPGEAGQTEVPALIVLIIREIWRTSGDEATRLVRQFRASVCGDSQSDQPKSAG